MSISENFALDIAEAFVLGDMKKEELIKLVPESAKEVLNVTVGNIIIDLDIVKQGKKVDISVPSALVGPTVIEKKQNGKMFVSKIKYNKEDIVLSYFT
jgi:CheY-specific phosphatase CheX